MRSVARASILVMLSSCTMYLEPLPTEPTSSQYTAAEAASKGASGLMHDCYNEMKDSRSSALARSFGGSLTTFLGGAVGVIGGFLAIVLKPSVSSDMPPQVSSTEKNVAAGVAAAGALATLGAQTFGDPSARAKTFENAVSSWYAAIAAYDDNKYPAMFAALTACARGNAPSQTAATFTR